MVPTFTNSTINPFYSFNFYLIDAVAAKVTVRVGRTEQQSEGHYEVTLLN